MLKKESLICRFCGEIGFVEKKVRGVKINTKNYSINTKPYYTNKNKRCKICKNVFIDDHNFSYWKQKKLTLGNQLNNRLKQIYSQKEISYPLFSIEDIHQFYLLQDFKKDYSIEFIKEFIRERKNYFKPKKVPKENKSVFDKTSDTVSKGFSLIPDSILGVGFYILIILFCIWFFGDYGGECGVDYAPRFFGEC